MRLAPKSTTTTLGWILLVSSFLLSSYTHAFSPPSISVLDRVTHGATKHPTVSSKTSLHTSDPLLSDTSSNPAHEGGVKKSLAREMMAECIGTFLIVQLGTGSVMSAIFTESLVGLFQIAAVWMIAVTIAISATASISGAHLNPAISLAFALIRPSKSFDWKKVLPYSLSQLLGAIVASGVNLALYASTIESFEKANQIVRASTATGSLSAMAFGEYFVSPITTATAFLVEALGTGILSFVVFALTNSKNVGMSTGFVAPLIGMTVGALISVLAPLTQGGFNPARDFGPRIVAYLAGWKSVAFQGWWVYALAPVVGATVGAFLADKMLYAED